MPGFNQQQLNYRVRNANSVLVSIGDVPIGFAQTVSHTFGFGTTPYYGVGSRLPQEIQQLRVGPQITIDTFKLTQNGLLVLGYPSDLSLILADTEFNFTIKGKDPANQTGGQLATLYTYVGGVCESFNENVPTNQTITDALTFLCADVLGPNGVSLLASSDAYNFPALATAPGVGGVAQNVG